MSNDDITMRLITREILNHVDNLGKLMPHTPKMIKSLANVVNAIGIFCRDMADFRMNEERKND